MNENSDLVCLYNSNILHIVDPSKPAVLSSCNGLRKIIDLSVYQNEIFVLEGMFETRICTRFIFKTLLSGHRSLVRIAQEEDIFDPKVVFHTFFMRLIIIQVNFFCKNSRLNCFQI